MDDAVDHLEQYSLPLIGIFEGTGNRLIQEGLPYGIVIWCDTQLDVHAYRLCRLVHLQHRVAFRLL